ncbi:hypothetical protein BC2230_40426 [Burkholderia cepacia]
MLLAGELSSQVGAGFVSRGAWTVASGRHIVNLYGFSRFIADLDNGRCYGRENDKSLIHSVLDWVATEGWYECYGEDSAVHSFGGFKDAHHYRHRYSDDIYNH